MSENNIKEHFPTPSAKKEEDFDILDFLKKLGFESDKIDEAAIERFRNSRVAEYLRKIFDKTSAEDKILFVAVDSLPEEEIKKLKNLAIKNYILPGIHQIRDVLQVLHTLTEDDKFLLPKPEIKS